MMAVAVTAVVVAGWVFWLGALVCARRALARRRPALVTRDAPAVSVLKPVRGLDVEAFANFASHSEQRYPTFEIVFGVADATDPAVPVIRELQARYGEARVRLVVAPDEAPNPKAGLLECLAREARFDVLVATDSDIRVAPDFLARVVARLFEPGVGLVTLPYRGEHVVGVPAAFEALGMETSFLPSAIVGQHVLGARFALGAANALTRETLDEIGGFRAVTEHIADDYQLGRLVAATGRRVVIAEFLVGSVLGAPTFGEWWRREVRWARAIRTSRPGHYPGLVVTLPTALAAAAWLGGAASWPLLGSLVVRWAVAWQILACTRHRALRRWLPLLPVRDVLAAAIWLAGLAGRTVVWRGRMFRIGPRGRLLPAPPRVGLAVRGVRRLDGYLRRRQGIFEFTDDARCVLRLSIARGDDGEPRGELHLWNEQLPARTSLGWAFALRRRLARSLRLLAEFVAHDAAFADLHVFEAELSLRSAYSLARLDAVARHFGFRATARPGRLRDHLHARLLRLAFPGPAERLGRLQRVRFTIARRELLARHLQVDRDGARA